MSAAQTPEDLSNIRRNGFAGAGVSLAIILLIAQISVPQLTPLLKWALNLAAVALPLSLVSAAVYDMWLACKLTGTDLNETRWKAKLHSIIGVVAFLLILGSVWCLLAHVSELSAGLFAVVVAFCIWWIALMVFTAIRIMLKKRVN